MAVNTKILGVNINTKKQILFAIQDIYGVGHTTAEEILKNTKIDPRSNAEVLSEEDFGKIRAEIESGKYIVEGDLRQKLYRNISRLKTIKSYRGLRHRVGLPVRGQRTRKNARTRKGRVKIAVQGLNKPVAKK